MSCKLILIGGGTASGKTTLAEELVARLGPERAVLVPVDAFYRCNAQRTAEERVSLNYDAPAALEFELLESVLADLLSGKPTKVPVYDFVTHSRKINFLEQSPVEIVVVEGILALYPASLRKLASCRIFVEASADVRFARRVERDVRERGRTAESVAKQWRETVEPSFREFCEPTKKFAEMVVDGEKDFVKVSDTICRVVL